MPRHFLLFFLFSPLFFVVRVVAIVNSFSDSISHHKWLIDAGRAVSLTVLKVNWHGRFGGEFLLFLNDHWGYFTKYGFNTHLNIISIHMEDYIKPCKEKGMIKTKLKNSLRVSAFHPFLWFRKWNWWYFYWIYYVYFTNTKSTNIFYTKNNMWWERTPFPSLKIWELKINILNNKFNKKILEQGVNNSSMAQKIR